MTVPESVELPRTIESRTVVGVGDCFVGVLLAMTVVGVLEGVGEGDEVGVCVDVVEVGVEIFVRIGVIS